MKINHRYVWMIILVFSVLLSGCGNSETKLAATKTKIAADIVATQTAAVPTLTRLAMPTATETMEPGLQKVVLTSAARATNMALPMLNLVQQLYDDGFLQSTQGEFISLGIYEAYYSELDWIQYTTIENEGSDDLRQFVLRADITWRIANENAQLENSGCGFLFGDNDIYNHHHLVILNLDGNLELFQCLDCDQLEIVSKVYYDKLDYMQGEAEMILIVEDDNMQVLIDGKRVISIDAQRPIRGSIGYAIASGLNTSFGMYCSFRNFEVWDLDP